MFTSSSTKGALITYFNGFISYTSDSNWGSDEEEERSDDDDSDYDPNEEDNDDDDYEDITDEDD